MNRTKQSLRRALLSLMADKGYEATSIQDIVDHADVGRSTFYAHYADKDDLLQENMAALADHLRSEMSSAPPSETHAALAFTRPLLEHVADVRPMFLGLLGPKSAPVVRACFHDTLAELVDERLPAGPPGEVPRQARVQVIVAAFLSLARWWVLEEPDRTVEQMHDIYVRLVTPMLSPVEPT